MSLPKLSLATTGVERSVVAIMIYLLLKSFHVCKADTTNVTQSICSPQSCNIWDIDQVYPHVGFPMSSFLTLPGCASCICDTDKCHIYGRYCNETDTMLSSQFIPVSSAVFTCKQLQLRHDKTAVYPINGPNVYTSMACPVSYHIDSNLYTHKNTTIDKCEHAENYNDLQTRVPVSDKRTGLTYGNKFCAECHGVPDDAMVFWNPRIQCYHESYWPSNYSTIVTDIQMTHGCNIIFDKPAELGLILPSCEIYTITFCNIHINAVCFTDTTETAVVCKLVPFREQTDSPFLCFVPVYEDPLFQSFALIFRYNPLEILVLQSEVGEHDSGCDLNEFHDQFKDICRPLMCSPPRSLHNRTCLSNVQTISGAIVEVFIKMIPVRKLASSNVSYFGEAIVQYGRELLTNMSIDNYSLELFVTGNSSVSDLYYVLHVIVKIVNNIYVRVTFIDLLLQIDVISVSLVGNTFNTELIQLQSLSELGYINMVDGEILTLYDIFQTNGSDVAPFAPTITLLSTTSCPLITLHIEEFDIQNFTWGIRVSELNANISNWHSIQHVDLAGQLTSIKICSGMYEELIRPYVAKSIAFSNSTSIEASQTFVQFSEVTTRYISLMCTCLSILCALLTFLTYSLFKDLRTQPGINNIALCVNLVIAQMMFQFGIGQTDNIPYWACVIIGIHIHFFWLSTVMWMHVCCIHSFEVLWTLNKHRDNRVSARRTGFYILYATILASLPVVVNIATHILTNGYTGYGRILCYLANNKIISLTFGLPIGVIIISNIILFIIILIKLNKPTYLNPATGKQRQFYGVYVRLSVLTGFMWIFGFIYMFTGDTWLEYIFIILNASQGVFIFISFICNKTCARKYLSLLHGHSTSETRGTRISNYTITRKTLNKN